VNWRLTLRGEAGPGSDMALRFWSTRGRFLLAYTGFGVAKSMAMAYRSQATNPTEVKR